MTSGEYGPTLLGLGNRPNYDATASEIHNQTSYKDEDVENQESLLSPCGHKDMPAHRLVFVAVPLCLCVFCLCLDVTILATAMSAITGEFQSIHHVGWYGASYLLIACIVQLPYGQLYTQYSSNSVFITAIVFFELGSLICATAPSSSMLILGRAIAGLGDAGMNSGVFVILVEMVPIADRAFYTALMGSTGSVAMLIGPLVGGALTDHLSWRWCFYMNIPIGVIAVIILLQIPAKKSEGGSISWRNMIHSFDILGNALLIPGIICLLLPLQIGGTAPSWNWSSTRVTCLLLASASMILLFIFSQIWRGDRAMLPPRVLRNRDVLGSTWYSSTIQSGFIIFIYYFPIWLQVVGSMSATKAGVLTLPTILGVVFAAVASGTIVHLVRYIPPFLVVSSILAIIGAWLLSTIGVTTNTVTLVGYQILYSVGIGIGIQNVMLVPQLAVSPCDVPTAVSISLFTRTLANSIFLVVAQSAFQKGLTRSLEHGPASGLDPNKLLHWGASRLADHFPLELLPSILEAYTSGVICVIKVSTVLSALSLIGAGCIKWNPIYAALSEREEETRRG